MSDIFLSYNREDEDRAKIFLNVFKDHGLDVWWRGKIPPGELFDVNIEKALEDAKCVVVLWSKNSVNSKWVKIEANEGEERGILVPVLIDDIKPPLAFRLTEAAELSGWDGTLPHPEFELLINRISEILGRQDAGKNTVEGLKKIYQPKDKDEISEINNFAQKLYDEGKYDEAIDQWNEVLKRDSKNKTATDGIEKAKEKIKLIKLTAEAQNSFENKQYDDAIEKWQEVLKLDRENREAIGGIEECKRILEKINALNSSAQKLYDEVKYRKAVDTWNEVLNLDPENKRATDGIEKVIKDVNKRLMTLIEDVHISLDNRQYADAIEKWEKVLKFSIEGIEPIRPEPEPDSTEPPRDGEEMPEEFESLYSKFKNAVQFAEPEKVIELGEKILKLKPGDGTVRSKTADAYLERAITHDINKDITSAENCFVKAYELGHPRAKDEMRKRNIPLNYGKIELGEIVNPIEETEPIRPEPEPDSTEHPRDVEEIPEEFESLYSKFKNAVQFAEPEKVIELGEKILNLKPGDGTVRSKTAEAYFDRAVAHDNNRNIESAKSDFERALELGHPRAKDEMCKRNIPLNYGKIELREIVNPIEETEPIRPEPEPDSTELPRDVEEIPEEFESLYSKFKNAVQFAEPEKVIELGEKILKLNAGDETARSDIRSDTARAYLECGLKHAREYKINKNKEAKEAAWNNFKRANELGHPDAEKEIRKLRYKKNRR